MRDYEKRLRQIRRTMLIIELLAPLRRGATVEELTRDISDDIGPVCKRTIQRDLESLEILGLVRKSGPDTETDRLARAQRWHWVTSSIRSAIHRHASEYLAGRELVA